MNRSEAEIIREQMRAYIRSRMGGVQYRLADKLGCPHRETLSNFLTGKTGTMRKGRIEAFQKIYVDEMQGVEVMAATKNVEPYGELLNRELAEAEIESIVGRLKQLIADLESPALMPWVKASQLVRVFKGVTDEFIRIREESDETTTR